ncbi:MAG: O-antigen ligase family protein [Elusimicrobiaceae bacterium]|nr:O-antigen ligase family protein [Elusimicrobiaceae bacterium]
MQTEQSPVKAEKSRLLTYWLSALCFFISLPLFLNSLDSAQIKITLYYMGALGALGLWISKLYFYKENIFTRQNLIKLLPFILYVGYVIIGYFFHPYIIGRAESLFKFLGICIFFSIVTFEFDKDDINLLFKAIVACAWIVGIYGLIQVMDIYIYKGVDLLYWTSAFQKRIFSTIANPNFLGNYCLFSLMLVLARFCHTHYKRYILLAAILLTDIFFTESKGAWMGLGVSLVIFAGVYLNFFKTKLSKHKKIINISALMLFLAIGALVVHFGAQRMQSVNFRLSTWRATWDMVQATPLTGTGLGSFQVIYQAYKRPDIFYMENLHNAETQHAENFFLEQWATLGILGLGLFLYLVFYQLKNAFKAFRYFEYTDDRETSYNLFAALMASTSIYLHNLVDVSIYFVSTMYFLALFNGVLFNLACGGLEKKKPENNQSKRAGVFSVIICFLASAFILFFAVFTGYQFVKIALSNNILLLGLYWSFLLVALVSVIYSFGYFIWKSKKIFVAIFLTFTAFLMFKAFGTLLADHYLNMASSMMVQGNPSSGLVYTKAISLNPFRTSVNQFKASFFVNRFDMRRKYLQQEGDTDPMTDFERADKYYNKEISLSPNNALVWHNRGLLYKKMAAYVGQKDFYEGEKYYKQSEAYFKRSLHLDPVYDNTYFQLADIAAKHRDFKTARIWLNMYMRGPEDIVNEEYLAQHKNNATAQKFDKIFEEEEKKLNEQNAK